MTDTQTAFVLVPREPTEEQLNAARDWSIKKYGMGVGNDGASGCYAAMLSAAPKPPESEIGPVLYAFGDLLPADGEEFEGDVLLSTRMDMEGGYDTPLYPQARIDADAAIIAALRAEVARLQECAVTWEHNWKSERDVKLQCVLHARAAERRAEAAEAREKELERRLRDETAIVDRIWDMFGRPSYEELAGRSIYDLIAELQARVALASKKETVDERPA